MPIQEMVQALTGEEVIIDVCEHIAEKLRRDCNLRECDSYTGGYSGTVKISLQLCGFNSELVDSTVVIGTPQDDPEAEVIDTTIEIPQEEDLTAVRKRSEQTAPNVELTQEGPVGVQKRRYTRRVPLGGIGHPATGGAVGEIDE